MKLTLKNEIKKVDFCGQEIEVTTKLDTYTKYAIITSALSGSKNGGRLSNILFEANLYALIAIRYTNLELEDMGAMKLPELYDILDSNGFFDLVLPLIDKKELDTLMDYAEKEYEEVFTHLNSGAVMVQNFAEEITKAILASAVVDKEKSSNNKAVN